MTPASIPTASPPKPAVLRQKTARTLAFMVLLAAVCQLLPGLDTLRWMPEDATRLIPRFLRFEHDALPWESSSQTLADTTPVDDEALLALGDADGSAPLGVGVSARAVAPPPPNPSGPATPTAPAAPSTDAPILLKTTYAEDTPLPPPPEPRTFGGNLTLMPIEDPHGVMDRFYASLERTSQGQGQTHVVHYGDSLLTGDFITQTLRRLFQKKFGDGGHGFVLGGMPSPWYRRQNLDIQVTGEWHVNRLTRPHLPSDGAYGLAGVCFHPEKAGNTIEYTVVNQNGTAGQIDGQPLNQSIDRATVFAWGAPDTGGFEVAADGRTLGQVRGMQPGGGALYAPFDLPAGTRKVRVTSTGGGDARLYGVALDRTGPGVIYDGLGLDGTRAKLLEGFDGPHWFAQLRARTPNLIVLHYGTNESEAADLGTKNYRQDLLSIVRRLRAGMPDVPCLLIGPMDRADNTAGELVSRPVVQRITDVQRRVAYMEGCAFYDTFKAMGGEGSMARWYNNHLAGGDFTHPTAGGADKLGAMIFAALMDGYKRAAR